MNQRVNEIKGLKVKVEVTIVLLVQSPLSQELFAKSTSQEGRMLFLDTNSKIQRQQPHHITLLANSSQFCFSYLPKDA